MTNFSRITYIRREEQIELILKHARAALSESRNCILYFEGRGGLGKTYLLEHCASIILEEQLDIHVCPLIDMYHFINRSPLQAELRMIESLTAAKGKFTIPPNDIHEIFRSYYELLDQYKRTKEYASIDNEQFEKNIHENFIECWSYLSHLYPIVICFDTVEALFTDAPDKALINTKEINTGSLVINKWMIDVLPRLNRTLVILSGRPINQNTLCKEFEKLGVLSEPVQILRPLDKYNEIQDYLASYGIEIPERDIVQVFRFTGGLPLLLTCYAQIYSNKSNLFDTIRRVEDFEDLLVDTILNPLKYYSNDPKSFTLTCCLYFLSYARRGISRQDLRSLFDKIGLSSKRDDNIIEHLDQISLIKTVSPKRSSEFPIDNHSAHTMLILHDEIFQIIDESKKPDQLGFRKLTLDYLCQITRHKIKESYKSHDINNRTQDMINNLYYEINRDIDEGYKFYTVYLDRLLWDRLPEEALLLADVFWETLSYRARQYKGHVSPYAEVLQKARTLTLESVIHDEQVRCLKLLLSRGRPPHEIAERARALYKQLVEDGVLPANQNWVTRSPTDKSAYLFASLICEWANALTLADVPGQQPQLERLFAAGLDFLDLEKNRWTDRLLHLRRQFFLGQLYTLRGQMLRQQQRYREARNDATAGRWAFLAYQNEPIAYLLDQEWPAEDTLTPKQMSAALIA